MYFYWRRRKSFGGSLKWFGKVLILLLLYISRFLCTKVYLRECDSKYLEISFTFSGEEMV